MPKALIDLADESRALKGERAAESRRKQAVFVSHGMGQQIPFETLDQIAEGLRREDERVREDARSRGIRVHPAPDPAVRAVRIGDERMQRVELQLFGGGGEEHEVHVYEGYWAPLTEGKVKLRDVIKFLYSAGLNGIKNAGKPFSRWLFGDYTKFLTPIRTVIYLVVALLTIVSLVVMNATIAGVAAGRSMFNNNPPSWLSDGLFADLATTFDWYLLLLILLGVTLAASRWLRAKTREKRAFKAVSAASVAAFFIVLAGTALAGFGIPLLFYYHVKCAPESGASALVWDRVMGARASCMFTTLFELLVVAAIMLLIAVLLLVWIKKMAAAIWMEWRDGSAKRKVWRTAAVCAGFLAILILIGLEIRLFMQMCPSSALGELSWDWSSVSSFFGTICNSTQGNPLARLIRRGISWPLLVAITALVRTLLVQYVGDVAAYVTSQSLDSFHELREAIKTTVFNKARAVYAAVSEAGTGFEYERISIVGHSLGSVVVYDTLNRLMNDDSLAVEQTSSGAEDKEVCFYDVITRTQQLVTFGSPLDKTAFLFALQGSATSEAREALAATVQPLIQHARYRERLEWTNVYSPWDIISGSLDLYDLPDRSNPNPVKNVVDPQATTLLVAHTEYWKNEKVFEVLHERLTR